jgi:hypothetical protein
LGDEVLFSVHPPGLLVGDDRLSIAWPHLSRWESGDRN